MADTDTLADELNNLVYAYYQEDNINEIINLIIDRITALAMGGESSAKVCFPLWATQADRDTITTALQNDGLSLLMNRETGLLEVSWK